MNRDNALFKRIIAALSRVANTVCHYCRKEILTGTPRYRLQGGDGDVCLECHKKGLK